MSTTPTRSHITAIDGLRTVSILAVISSHGVHTLQGLFGRGGWLGVDVFFVISGFLITRILFNSWHKGDLGLKSFYLNRVLRIIPALYTLLAITLVFNPFHAHDVIMPTIIGATFMGDYFPDLIKGSGLGITWSLGVEEKFYLCFPFLFFAYLKSRKLVYLVLPYLSIFAWKAYLVAQNTNWERMTLAFDTRFDVIFAGVFGAIVLHKILQKPAASKYLAPLLKSNWYSLAAGTIAIIFMRKLHHPTEINGLGAQILYWLAWMPAFNWLIASLCVSLTLNTKSLLARFLSLPPIVYIGKISYSLYLWHILAFELVNQYAMPRYSLQQLDHHRVILDTVYLLVALAFAACSYHFIEKPFLRLKKNSSDPLPESRASEINTAADLAKDSEMVSSK